MDKIAITRLASQEFGDESNVFEGLVGISHLSNSEALLPNQFSLVSADSPDRLQLDLLFPLSSIADYVIEQLRPSAVNPIIFSPSQFRDALSAWQDELQVLALRRHPDARKFGRLANLLTQRDALSRLAQMYSSALLQG
jgi:hypothetical protein